MPTLKWFPGSGPPRSFPLYKPVSTIGRALGNDVAITSSKMAETHAQVLFDGRDFNLEEGDKAGEAVPSMNPINHASTGAGGERDKVGPYVRAADD